MTTTDLRGVLVSSTDPNIASNPNPDLAIKAPCVVATTGANITLSGLQTIDGYTTLAGDRVLVKDQTNQAQNGIYNAATGPWTPAYDAQSNTQWAAGTWVLVTGGSVNANVAFAQTTPGPIVLGTTSLVFVAFPFANLVASQIRFTSLGTGAVASTVNAELQRGYLHSKDFGATGNGTTDDTTALQTWLNAAASLGIPGFLDPGTYLISSALTVTNNNGISIFGPESTPPNPTAKIVMGSLTQDGIQFNTTGRIFLKGFSIVSSGIPTAGSALNFQGGTNQSVGGFIERLVLGFGNTTGSCWNGITATGLAAFTLHECDITAQNICLNVASPGDSEVQNNRFTPVSSTAIGVQVTGDPGGIRLLSNKFNSAVAYLASVSITVAASTSDGDIFIIGNSMESVFANGYGIIIAQQGGATFANILIIGNEISCPGSGSWGIYFSNTTLHWLTSVIIASNVVSSYEGVFLGAMDDWTFTGNVLTGAVAELSIGANCTLGAVVGNVLSAISDASTGTVKANNQGVAATTPQLLAVLGQPNGTVYNAADLNFTGFSSAYDNYMLVFENLCPSSSSAVAAELLQYDGGAFQTTTYVNAAGSATTYVDLLAGGTAASGDGAGYGISGVVYVHDVNATGGVVKSWEGQMTHSKNTPSIAVNTVAGLRNTNNTIGGFQFQFSSGNVASGQIKVYGLP
jgi:hypothetical protein